MKRRTELSDTEQEAHDDAKADALTASESLAEKLTDPRTLCEALKYNVELRCFVTEIVSAALFFHGDSRTARLIEAANKIEREVSRA